jgi:uncharacterized membrane protein YfcA
MNRGGLANVVVGVLLLCLATFMLFTGNVIARPPSLSTRENSPILFWLEFAAFGAAGLLLLVHGVARASGIVPSFVARIDETAALAHTKLFPWKAK